LERERKFRTRGNDFLKGRKGDAGREVAANLRQLRRKSDSSRVGTGRVLPRDQTPVRAGSRAARERDLSVKNDAGTLFEKKTTGKGKRKERVRGRRPKEKGPGEGLIQRSSLHRAEGNGGTKNG